MAKGIKNVFIESDSVGVLGTKIYRDGILIATVPVGTAFYEDPTAIEGVQYKYVNQAYTSTSESTDEVEGVNMDYYTIQAETTLTPIMTNFRVEDANKDRVYFDTPLGPVTGMNTTGFVISGNNITGVDTTNNYFTVDSAFNYFDNNTIRLGENDSTGDVNATIHNFTLEYIENNITEPVSTGNKYVTATASGGNGSEGSPWTLQESFDQAVGGETVWVKSGDYGTFQDNITSRNGTASAPIKWVGYKDTIGDITTNYWDYGVTMVNTEMPTFTGTADYNIRFNNSSYLILRNFQFRGGQTSIERSGDADYIEMDRFNINQMYGGIVLFQDTANSQLKNIRAINSIVNCYGLQNIIIRGAEANMIKDCKAYVDGTNGPVDYSMTIGGQNSMVISSYVENFLSDQGSLHGISIRDAYRIDSSYCLVQDCESVNYQECYAFRNIGASYNVVKNSLARNNGATYTNDRYGVVYDGSGAYNITENVNISECDRGVVFSDDSTESSSVKVGDHSIIRNCIIDDCIIAITFAGADSDLSTNEGISFYHNTFKDCDYLTFQHSYFLNLNGGVDMVNNIIDSVPVGFSTSGDYAQPTPSDFTFINNDFFNTSTWGNTYIGSDGNIGEDPDLDSSFVPQADFSLISKARVDGVYYDMDGVTRADPTTLGSKLSPSEEAGEQPPVEDYDYYVSFTDGDDSNDGKTPETAWKTTTNVVNNRTGFLPTDVIAFNGGDKWHGRMYLDDMTAGVTLTSYGTGRPEITGFEEITGFTEGSANIWSVQAAAAYIVSNDELPMTCARFPVLVSDSAMEGNYTTVTSVADQTNITISSMAGLTDLVGANIFIFTDQWILESRTITAYNNSTGEITIDSTMDGNIEAGVYCYVNNHINLLANNLDYVYNGSTLTIYNTSIPTNINIGTDANSGIQLGRGGYTVNNIKISGFNIAGLDLAPDNDGDINNVTVTNCLLLNNRAAGTLNWFGSGDVYTNNTFKGNWFRSIISSDHGVTIRYNDFSETGLMSQQGHQQLYAKNTPTISAGQMSTIEYNTIKDVGYHGIIAQGGVHNIRYNYIENPLLSIEDGGAIYFGDGGSGSVVENNIVIGHADQSALWNAQGLYADENTTGITWRNNTVIGYKLGIQIHVAAGSTFTGNKLYKSLSNSLRTDDKNFSTDVLNHVITGNDMYVELASSQVGIYNYDGNNYDIGTIDSNNYFNTLSDNTVKILTGDTDGNYTLAEWVTLLPAENQNSTDKGSLTITDSQCVYNATNSQVITPIIGTWQDLSGNQYTDNITLEPWSGEILIQVESGLGPELVTEGDFENGGAAWNIVGQCTVNTGVGRILSDGTYGYVEQSVVFETGKSYQIEYDVTDTDGAIITNDVGDFSYDTATLGHKIQQLIDGEQAFTTGLVFKRNGVCDVSVDNVSVKEII